MKALLFSLLVAVSYSVGAAETIVVDLTKHTRVNYACSELDPPEGAELVQSFSLYRILDDGNTIKMQTNVFDKSVGKEIIDSCMFVFPVARGSNQHVIRASDGVSDSAIREADTLVVIASPPTSIPTGLAVVPLP